MAGERDLTKPDNPADDDPKMLTAELAKGMAGERDLTKRLKWGLLHVEQTMLFYT